MFVADPDTCFGYFECEGGGAQYAECPPGYLFSNTTNQCHQDVSGSCAHTGVNLPHGELMDYLADLRDAGILGGPLSVGNGGGAVSKYIFLSMCAIRHVRNTLCPGDGAL